MIKSFKVSENIFKRENDTFSTQKLFEKIKINNASFSETVLSRYIALPPIFLIR